MKIEHVLLSLNGEVPLSITCTVIKLVPGATALVVTHEKTPLEELMQEARERIPAGRFGTPAEFGAACAFLCSVHAGYVAGQNVLIDGGAYPGTF